MYQKCVVIQNESSFIRVLTVSFVRAVVHDCATRKTMGRYVSYTSLLSVYTNIGHCTSAKKLLHDLVIRKGAVDRMRQVIRSTGDGVRVAGAATLGPPRGGVFCRSGPEHARHKPLDYIVRRQHFQLPGAHCERQCWTTKTAYKRSILMMRKLKILVASAEARAFLISPNAYRTTALNTQFLSSTLEQRPTTLGEKS